MSTVNRKGKEKVRPIKWPGEGLDQKGLPLNLDAERFILGSLLLDESLFAQATQLTPEDFTLQRHKEIFRVIQDLRGDNEAVDRLLVANELERRGQLGHDGASYLSYLDEGLPKLENIGRYVGVVIEKSTLRNIVLAGQQLQNEVQLGGNSAEILERHSHLVQELSQRTGHGITVDTLESIFVDPPPITYLIDPEIPAGAVVYLAGDSESGKSTVACAWARDLVAKGHPVLLLDRDRNPRNVIVDRFQRLGMGDHRLLRVWDCQQAAEVPQPDDPVVVAWVERMMKETRKPPLVIVDSLIGFLRDGESENDSVCMRALFDRCKILTRLSASVTLIHHIGKNGEARGSSDFRPAADQGFAVTNYNPDGSRLICKVTLKVMKSRYGLTADLLYNYASGKFLRDESHKAAIETASEHLTSLLRTHPGIATKAFYQLATKSGITEARAADWLKQGVLSGIIERRDGPRNAKLHYLAGQDSPDSISSFVNESTAKP